MTDLSRTTQPRSTRRTVLAAGVGTLAAGIAGCLDEDPQEDNGVDGDDITSEDDGDGEDDAYTVAAGMPALWDFTREVGGDHVNAVDLVPTGEHGHDYEPGPGIVEEIEEADAFVYMREFAGWMDDAVAELEDDDSVAVIDASEGIEFFDSPAEDDDEHWWMDPIECQNGVDNIAAGFAELDPDHADEYDENATAFNEELEEIHEEFEELVDRATLDEIVIGTHDSFQWWNRRYDIDVYSPIGTSPDGEASAQDIEEVENHIEEYGIEHVLYDVGEPAHLAESIADETGAEVLPISPVETQLDETTEVGDVEMESDWGYVAHYQEINFPSLERALQTA
ncbi:metal ABC transporter periplasmic protein [Natronococcus amylolyticus DSM 10524]|uniref:Metal ABC transporter periplasmic protein n=1 Tax=Natronococcus amylolyticus DSM 10524 TaxID=1227497 RepID=L9XD56_9EURY|nr:zinc ABC transporter substrate-binding protein [Natronococcus amylolyticus]ELY59557.1 metal ABC transporter periplasmic protein [Natronococcus amylolyticus DSM 10524]